MPSIIASRGHFASRLRSRGSDTSFCASRERPAVLTRTGNLSRPPGSLLNLVSKPSPGCWWASPSRLLAPPVPWAVFALLVARQLLALVVEARWLEPAEWQARPRRHPPSPGPASPRLTTPMRAVGRRDLEGGRYTLRQIVPSPALD